MSTSSEASPFPPFLYLPADQLDGHGQTLAGIYDGSILGAVIQGLYTPEQVQTVIQRALAHEAPPFKAQWPSYSMLEEPPYELGMALFSSSGELGPYLEKAAAQRAFYDELFEGMPPLQGSLERAFHALSGGVTPELAPGSEYEEKYTPGTVRVMTPGGGLKIHVGLDLLEGIPANDRLRPLLDTSVQFSYFLTLQAVEEGGELVIYGLSYDEVRRRAADPTIPVKPGALLIQEQAAVYVRSRVRMAIRPQPGDLLVFNGGNWYHEVSDPVRQTRWTIGGFLAYTPDHARLLYWA